jgi:Response regulator containing CheY-like receiver domain and AraC-type DNA-binding domain
MITIIIADDEKLIRAGIKKMLKDAFGDVVSVLEAKNGKEAYELTRTEQPDVIITDIRMPEMDGVELMRKLSAAEHKPAIIVLSGYDDFTYAKAAISSGALSYILKPVDTRELINSVNSAITAAHKEEKERSERALRTIMTEGYVDTDAELHGCKFSNGMYCVSVCGKHCSEALSSMLNQVQYYTLEKKKDFTCLVIPREALYLVETGVSMSPFIVGISSAADNVMEIRTLRRESYSALMQFFFSTTGRQTTHGAGVYYYTEKNTVADFSDIDARYEKCIGCLDILSTEDVQKALDSMFDFSSFLLEQRAECLRYLYEKIVNNLFKHYPGYSDSDMYLRLKGIMIENIWHSDALSEWKGYVSDYTVYLAVVLKRHSEPYPFITKAIDYINKHYKENINMSVVANYVSVNYSWFSEKFKEQIGVNFNEYLKRLRLEEAERLLEKGCYKVYEVAERSGFGDVKYFMKTFRASTGMSPTEWKNKHLE